MKVQRIVKLKYFIFPFIFFVINIFFTPQLISQQNTTDIRSLIDKGSALEVLFPDSSVYYYQTALNLIDSEKLDTRQNLKVDLLCRIGKIFHLQSKYSFANDYYSNALTESRLIKNDSLVAECNFNIAEINLENGSYAKAVESYYDAKNLYNETNNIEGVFWSNIGLGIIYRELGNTELSKKHYQTAENIGEEEGKEDYIAISFNNLGNLHKQIGEYETALDYLQKALKSFENFGEEKFISDCLESIGEVYVEINNHERALEYFNKSAEIAEILGDKYRLLTRYANIAKSYVKAGNNEKAIMYFSKTTELAQSIGDKARLSEVLIMVSDFYKSNNDLDNALANLNKSLLISKDVGDTVSIAMALNSLSELYFRKKEYNNAYQNALQAYQISSQKNLMKTLAESAFSMSRILELHGNFKDAFYYFKIHKKTQDLLLDSDKLKIVEDKETKYNVERIEKEKLELENAAITKEEKLKTRNILINVLIIAIALFVIVGGWYIYKKRKEKVESSEKSLRMKRKIDLLNNQLNEKNRELTSKALLISQNNEILKDVVTQIEEYLQNENSDKNVLKKLKIKLQQIYEETSWDDFMQHFELVHPNFYKKLVAKFGDLTPNEQKVCAFLKMNLNTKDISQITGQSTKAIEVMRSRIRKKLDISHDENLSSAIQTI
ncbi:MAG: tetratricopeptide repeat protein [Ignavibacteriales bacterium]|nr:tetratricopeptide repeat protein [Ignavibacteriales bacterium]